jgi:hypothetical protein
MVTVMPQSLYHRWTDILPFLQDGVKQGSVQKGVEKKNFLVSPVFETGTLHLVVSRYIDYYIPEYTGGTDLYFLWK